ncbi:acyl-CoA/acyl-ACP dehydrogenase [Candidatus Binatia bacterium]|nr:acyl-CoA/acyl-ACP dehydrogenase [Candidatus Binatia bacterium]
MPFSFDDAQEQLRVELRRFLDEVSPPGEVRRLMKTERGWDRALWQRMACELGLQGLAVPAELGGAGLGPVERLVVLEEMGRALLCAPYLACAVLAVEALRASGDAAAQRELLPGIASGTTVATLAVAEEDGAWNPTSAMRTRADRRDDAWAIDGRKSYVLDGAHADCLLVAAQTLRGPSLFLVAGDAPGLVRRSLQTLDGTRRQAELTFAAVPARLIGVEGDAARVVAHAVTSALVALAAEQVGGAARCLERSVEYAKTRVQFGRPIGGFQAIKHRCADLLLALESARSAAYAAAWAEADASPELPLLASLAKALCSETYVQVATEMIQIHGGIGFTWEHDAHLYFRRARSSEAMLGSPVHHREVAATYLLDGVA